MWHRRPSSKTGRRRIPAVIASIALAVAVVVSGAASAAGTTVINAGLVTDATGLGDNGFNDMAYTGLERARDDLGATIEVREPADDSAYGATIDAAVGAGNDVVFSVGWTMTEITATKAVQYPGTKFAGIDQVHGVIPSNMVDITFREEESGYLAGVLAGLATLNDFDARLNRQNIIGFIGGMDVPAVQRFETGYIAGAKSVNPYVSVISTYADSFVDTDRGEEIALEQIAQGADIVFAAAGGVGVGAVTACQDAGALFLGVDVDQYLTIPGSGDVILSSAMKRLDEAVFAVSKLVNDGTFVGGQELSFGLAEDGVGLAPFHDFDSVVPQSIRDAIANAETKIAAGKVDVPTTRDELYSAPASYVPVQGTNRFKTAVMASQEAFPNGAPCVVIATGRNFPDALGGAALAAAKGGPILLTDTNVLPNEVLAEIDRLGAGEAIILGGTSAVSDEVQTALLAELGKGNVTRVGGSDRYKTAEMVAKLTVKELGAEYDGVAFVATGMKFPDALGASPLAAAKGWPLYLAPSGGLTASTKAAMKDAGVDTVLILGGTGVVSNTVENELASLYGAGSVERLWGDNRYQTAAAVAAYGVEHAGLHWDYLALATGENFPDALAGGVLQGQASSVLLLTDGEALSSPTASILKDNKVVIDHVRYLGGVAAISQNVRDAVARQLK